MNSSASSTRLSLILLGLLLIITAFAFSPALRGGFVWDDETLIVRNRYVRDFHNAGRAFHSDFWDVGGQTAGQGQAQYANHYWRPLVTLSFMANYAISGLSPFGYHLANLLLHLTCIVLVWILCTWLFPRQAWLALLATSVFALHPSRVEAVAWISGRSELLAALFALGSLLAFLHIFSEPRSQRMHLLWTIVGFGAFIGALCAKESAVVVALLVPTLDLLLSRRRSEDAATWRSNALRLHLPLLVLAFGFAAWRLSSQSHAGSLATAPQRPLMVLESIGYYLRLFVNPFDAHTRTSAIYVHYSPRVAPIILGIAAICGLAVVIAANARKRPLLAVGCAFVGLTFAPVLNLFPLGLSTLVSERFSYLPYVGLGLMLVSVLAGRRPSTRANTIVGVAAALLLATWTATTYVRCHDYQSNRRFWAAAVAGAPDDPFALMQYGQALLRDHDLARALPLLEQSSAGWQRVHDLAGLIDTKLMLIDARAMVNANNAGALLASLRELSQFKAAALGAGAMDSRVTGILVSLANVQGRLGHNEDAIANLQLAAQRAPESLVVWLNLAAAQAREAHWREAERSLERAHAIDANAPEVARLYELIRSAQPRPNK